MHRRPSRLTFRFVGRRIARTILGMFVLVCTLVVIGQTDVYADVPAVTDFGTTSATPVLADHRPVSYALFLTLSKNGACDAHIQEIHDDAVNGFASAHPPWRADEGLRVLFRMPVYVREIEQIQTDKRSV